jgi:hypothetical protein
MAPEWKLMRRRTIWLICEGLGCIKVAIREVKTEIPVKYELPHASHDRDTEAAILPQCLVSR